MPRRKDEAVETVAVAEKPSPRAKAVTAIFDPIGNVRVNLTAPSGREYQIAPRVPFEIAPGDVDWFFYEWDWQHRQRLARAEEYAPAPGYRDAPSDEAPKAPGSGVYSDAPADEAPEATVLAGPQYADTGEDAPGITAEAREARENQVAAEAETDE